MGVADVFCSNRFLGQANHFNQTAKFLVFPHLRPGFSAVRFMGEPSNGDFSIFHHSKTVDK